ncbi:NADPH-dependent oxidoreductase [Candidatus Marinamargulisbacteria bacterium SCGC AG-343-D04]|nr:NADPH-dependent oxidoreductase [Candidatus Marinamargulisbacteria bacterium SCGC AG-343-D04]
MRRLPQNRKYWYTRVVMNDIVILTATEGKNLELAHSVKQEIDSVGKKAIVVNIPRLNLPLYSSQTTDQQEALTSQLESIVDSLVKAPAFVVLSPEYNGSTAPTLSNFLAWVSVCTEDFRACFNGKAAAIMSYSGAGTNVLQIMRLQLSYLGMNVLGRQLLANGGKPAKESSIKSIVEELLRLAR